MTLLDFREIIQSRSSNSHKYSLQRLLTPLACESSERVEIRHVLEYLSHHWLLLRMLLSTVQNWWEQESARLGKSSYHSQEKRWHKPKLKHLQNFIHYLLSLDTATATPTALWLLQNQQRGARRYAVPLGSWYMLWATGHQHVLPGEPRPVLLAIELPAVPCPSDQWQRWDSRCPSAAT